MKLHRTIKALFILILLMVGSSGCKSRTIVKRELVEVPVLVFKNPPKPAKVNFVEVPVEKLNLEDFDKENMTQEDMKIIASAYVDSLAILYSLIEQYKEALKPFIQPLPKELQ